AQPQYALEMALLKWIHLRKLVPLTDLIAQLDRGGLPPPTGGRPGPSAPARPATPAGRPSFAPRPASPRSGPSRPEPAAAARQSAPAAARPAQAGAAPATPAGPLPPDFKNRFLAELQRVNRTFFSLYVAQAQKIEIE